MNNNSTVTNKLVLFADRTDAIRNCYINQITIDKRVCYVANGPNRFYCRSDLIAKCNGLTPELRANWKYFCHLLPE